jgi:hypothetical protein
MHRQTCFSVTQFTWAAIFLTGLMGHAAAAELKVLFPQGRDAFQTRLGEFVPQAASIGSFNPEPAATVQYVRRRRWLRVKRLETTRWARNGIGRGPGHGARREIWSGARDGAEQWLRC